MNEEDKEVLYKKLLEVAELLYVLEMALDNDMQKTGDTMPYASFARLIYNKLADASEILQV